MKSRFSSQNRDFKGGKISMSCNSPTRWDFSNLTLAWCSVMKCGHFDSLLMYFCSPIMVFRKSCFSRFSKKVHVHNVAFDIRSDFAYNFSNMFIMISSTYKKMFSKKSLLITILELLFLIIPYSVKLLQTSFKWSQSKQQQYIHPRNKWKIHGFWRHFHLTRLALLPTRPRARIFHSENQFRWNFKCDWNTLKASENRSLRYSNSRCCSSLIWVLDKVSSAAWTSWIREQEERRKAT